MKEIIVSQYNRDMDISHIYREIFTDDEYRMPVSIRLIGIGPGMIIENDGIEKYIGNFELEFD